MRRRIQDISSGIFFLKLLSEENLNINIITHYPETKEKARLLEEKSAELHAEALINILKNLNCPKEQKIKLFEEVKKVYRNKR